MDTKNNFLGRGWGFPPTFYPSDQEVGMTTAAENIEESIGVILSTLPGERILHPDFGCDLHQFVFEELDQELITGLQTQISDALLYFEPRIEINEVDIHEDENDSTVLFISIDYTIRSTNSRSNLVYPFYLNENNHPSVFPVKE